MIRQRTSHDCGICTIAMALNRTYDKVMEVALKERAFDPEKGMRREYAVLEAFGLEQMVDFRVMHRSVIDAAFFRQFSWGRRAILAVPSLNFAGQFHSVYWTGRELLDPSTLQTYSEWNALLPNEIILFTEAHGGAIG